MSLQIRRMHFKREIAPRDGIELFASGKNFRRSQSTRFSALAPSASARCRFDVLRQTLGEGVHQHVDDRAHPSTVSGVGGVFANTSIKRPSCNACAATKRGKAASPKLAKKARTFGAKKPH